MTRGLELYLHNKPRVIFPQENRTLNEQPQPWLTIVQAVNRDSIYRTRTNSKVKGANKSHASDSPVSRGLVRGNFHGQNEIGRVAGCAERSRSHRRFVNWTLVHTALGPLVAHLG